MNLFTSPQLRSSLYRQWGIAPRVLKVIRETPLLWIVRASGIEFALRKQPLKRS